MNTRSALFILTMAAVALACARPDSEPSAEDVAHSVAADSTQRAAVVAQLVTKHLAAMEAGNVALLDSLSGPDFTHINSAGEKLTRAQLLDRARVGNAVGYDVVSLKTRVFGDVVVVNAQIKEKTTGKLHELTQVWVGRHGKAVAAADVAGKSPIRKASRAIRFTQAAADPSASTSFMYSCMVSHSTASATSSDAVSESAMNKPTTAPDISAGRSGQ